MYFKCGFSLHAYLSSTLDAYLLPLSVIYSFAFAFFNVLLFGADSAMSLDGQVPRPPPRALPRSFQDILRHSSLSSGSRQLLAQVLEGFDHGAVAGSVQMEMDLAPEEEEDEENADEEDERIPLDPVDVNLLSNEDDDDDDDDTAATATPLELELPDGGYRFEPYINTDPEPRTRSWDPYSAIHPPFADEGVDITPGIPIRVPHTSELISALSDNHNVLASSTSRRLMSIPLYQHPDNLVPQDLDIFAFQGWGVDVDGSVLPE
ncbi:hypothetical protein CPB84DRAFT_1144084 [Gymnopilus junonius]|uniref:Uncharacterized protein n=1 Tax=Gymnopilus junonius TaxID=109634 RepID=A0A9P5NMB5_GYMJU|nr:hypothetical protein CPB84DRAFT_1144084 [Gymnopilus junonius]